jgi:hypothetical protein
VLNRCLSAFSKRYRQQLFRSLFNMKTYDITGPTPQGPAARDQQTFLQGLEFHEAAIRSATTQVDEQGAPAVALCPMIVSFAFAIELYLKSLIPAGARGHDLEALFAKLSSPVRKRIQEAYLARTGRNHTALDGDLKKFAGAFADWRYIFEGEGQQIYTNLLAALAKAVAETAISIEPEWPGAAHHKRQLDRLMVADTELIMTVKNLGGGVFVGFVDGTGGTLNTPDA